MRQLVPGLLFALLWASASVATKFGVQAAPPLILANVRFMIAGSAMLLYLYLLKPTRASLPRGTEWKQLLLFALLNTTLYLGAFVLALQEVSAGIGSLATATSPLFITLLSAIWLKRPLRWFEGAGLLFGLAGVSLATWPLLQSSYATASGLVILLAGMVSVSAATVYYARIPWRLSALEINGWQVWLGGLLLLPVTLFTTRWQDAHWNTQFWSSVSWLIVPVSIIALQLWFYLVRQDAVKASLWLFLCPIFGFIYSATLLGEPITLFTWLGTGLVLAGLYLGQWEKFK